MLPVEIVLVVTFLEQAAHVEQASQYGSSAVVDKTYRIKRNQFAQLPVSVERKREAAFHS